MVILINKLHQQNNRPDDYVAYIGIVGFLCLYCGLKLRFLNQQNKCVFHLFFHFLFVIKLIGLLMDIEIVIANKETAAKR